MPVKGFIFIPQPLILTQNRFKCIYCDCALIHHKHLGYINRSKDHIIAKSKNGSESQYNLAWCCKECNSIKGDLSLENFKVKLINMYRNNLYQYEYKYKTWMKNVDMVIEYRNSNLLLMLKR